MTPMLGHGDRHARFGDRVHCGRDDGNVQRDRPRQVRADVRFRRKDFRQAGLQQNVIESERFADTVTPALYTIHCHILRFRLGLAKR
jgi:hypothetical protein